MKSETKKYSFFLFLVAPFLSLIVLSAKYKERFFLNLFWLFFGFLGLILITSDESKDSYRYALWFNQFSLMDGQGKATFFTDENTLDFFRPLTFYFTSFFTSDPKYYFVVVALVYGYFYSRILGMLFSEIRASLDINRVLVLITFIFVISLTSFQFIRFSTAIVIFLYFVLKYSYSDRNVKFILFSSLSVFVHFSFVFPVVMLCIFHFVPKKPELYFFFFLITSFIIIFDFSSLKVFIESYLPSQLDSKKVYLNEDYRENVVQSFEDRNWYIRYRSEIMNYTALLFIALFLFGKFRNCIHQAQNNLLSFALFFGIFANIVAVVPSGFRFLNLVYPLIWFILITLIINYFEFQKRPILGAFLVSVLIFNLVIGARYLTDDLPIEFFIGNYLTVLFFETTDVPLIAFVKSIF